MADAPFGFAPQDMMQGTAPVEGAGQYLAPIMEMYRRKLDPQTYISMAKSLLSLPQRSMEAAHEGAAGGPVDVGPAMETAMSMGGARFPFIGRGEAGIFGGRLAATADKAALAKAEDMLAKGATPESIWKDTGWFQGVDGKWRFEIPDNPSTMKGAGSVSEITGQRGATVGDAFFHPELYAAYPDLAKIELHGSHVSPTKGAYLRGDILDPDVGPMIRVGNDLKDARGTLLHELQHGVQETEGFATGSNPYALSPGTPAWDIYQQRLTAIRESGKVTREEFSKRAGYDGLAPAKEYRDFVKSTRRIAPSIDRAAQDYAVQEAYRRHAGEVEARNVQKRLNMTPEERKATPPWLTEDVPREQQIIRPAPGGSFGSWAP